MSMNKYKFKNNFFFLIFINISIFINYRLFFILFVAFIAITQLKDVSLKKYELVLLKLIPLSYFVNAFLNTFNNNQKSSIFWDMQNFLHYIRCNSSNEPYTYNFDLTLRQCPETIGYGPLTDLIFISFQNIWLLTLTMFLLFSIFLVYTLIKSNEKVLIITTTLVSPGVHFLIFSLSSDIFVIFYLTYLIFAKKDSLSVGNLLLLTAITQIKIFPIAFFLGYILIFYYKKEIKNVLIYVLFFICNAALILNHLLIGGNIIPAPISFTRSFGLLHDFRILNEYIGFDEFFILIFILLIFLLIFRKSLINLILNFDINLDQHITNNILLILPTLFLINSYQNWGYKFVFNSIFIILIFQSLNKGYKIYTMIVTLLSSTYYLIGWGFDESVINFILIILSKLSFYSFYIFLLLLTFNIFKKIRN